MDRHRGQTLTELVFTLAIAAGLLAWGVPAFRSLYLDASRTREVNGFVHGVHFARQEAIRRNGVVSLCPSLDGRDCGPAGTPWHRGWIVFANDDADAPAVRDPDEPLLRAVGPWLRGSVDSSRRTLSFRPFGQMGVTGTFTYCDARGSAAARAVIISQTGRPRVADRSSTGSALSCP